MLSDPEATAEEHRVVTSNSKDYGVDRHEESSTQQAMQRPTQVSHEDLY